jgi:hypothetical protein
LPAASTAIASPVEDGSATSVAALAAPGGDHCGDSAISSILVEGDSSHGIMVQLSIVSPNLIRPFTEKPLVGHIRLQKENMKLTL